MKSILLLFFVSLGVSNFAFAQDRKITGKVVDQQSGMALSGVTVNIKGTAVSTSTDASGSFSLDAPPGKNILTFTYVGYESKEASIKNHNVLSIALEATTKQLNEVVITALNMKRSARSLGYSVATLDGSAIDKVQAPNLITALSGKVAGVDVGNIANGVAGTKRIVIRGGSSLTGNNQPLWVIDGIPINSSSLGETDAGGGIDYGDGLTGLNPDDIESISVLKGNAAAALYGSRASNGVILVTTKSGKANQGKMKIDVSSSVLFDKLRDITDFQYEYGQNSVHNSPELPIDAEDAFTSDSWGHKLDGSMAPQFDGVSRPFTAHKNNYESFFRTGNTINNTISLSGGNANNDYRLSVSDLRNTDIIPNSNFTRTSVNTKTHSKFGKLDVDLVLNYIYENSHNRPYIGGNHDNQFYSLLYLPSNIDVKTLSPGYDSTGREVVYAESLSNPYYIINKEKETDSRNRLIGSITLKYQILKFLYARGRITRDYYVAKRFRYIPDNNLSSSYPDGSLDQQSRENVSNNYEFLLGINPGDFGKFAVNAFAGGNVSWRASTLAVTSGNSFVVPGVYTFNNLANKLPQTSVSERRTNSLFGDVEFSYDKILYLTLTGRNDWFSTLPLKSNNLFYPAASLSFIFSDALKLPSWISYGKLRASSAQVSGDTDPYQLDLSYSLNALQYDGLPIQAIGTGTIPNKDLKPLLSTDYEVGLEMGFLNDRAGFDIDYFNKNVKNDIVTTAVANTSGYSYAVLNVGELSYSGWEFLFRGMPVKTNSFSWDITLSYSSLDDKVVKLGEGTKGANIILTRSKSGNASVQLEEGQRYGGIYGYTYKRDDAGNIIYTAAGLPEYNKDQRLIGNSQYKSMLGFSNTFRYKNISLYVFLDGKFGADIYSETNATAYDEGKSKATLPGREDGLVPKGVDENGQPVTVLVRGYNSPDGPGSSISSYYKEIKQVSEQFIYDASFVKLRELSLSYNFSSHLLKKAGFTNASVAVVARNLLTIYKDKNLVNVDPESSVASGNAQGIERMVYPVTRSYGITLKFGL